MSVVRDQRPVVAATYATDNGQLTSDTACTMDTSATRTTVSQLADDLAWLEQHAREQPKQAAKAGALRLAAWSLIRSHSYLGAYLRRQRSRLGAPKAITATAHKLARIVYNLMRYCLAYVTRDEAAYAAQVQQRLEKQLHRRARELGFAVVRVEPPAAAEPSPEVAMTV